MLNTLEVSQTRGFLRERNLTYWHYQLSKFGVLGRVLRKRVNANPALKVNRSIHFSVIKVSFTDCLCFDLFRVVEIIPTQN